MWPRDVSHFGFDPWHWISQTWWYIVVFRMLETGGSKVCGHPQLFNQLKAILQDMRLYLTNPSEWVWTQPILPKANVCIDVQETEWPSYWCSILEMPENHLWYRVLLLQFLFSVLFVRQKPSNTPSLREWTSCTRTFPWWYVFWCVLVFQL